MTTRREPDPWQIGALLILAALGAGLGAAVVVVHFLPFLWQHS